MTPEEQEFFRENMEKLIEICHQISSFRITANSAAPISVPSERVRSKLMAAYTSIEELVYLYVEPGRDWPNNPPHDKMGG